MKAVNAPFIAADVGGTHARVGLVREADDGRVDVLAYRKYSCAHYPDLAALLNAFIEQEVDVKVNRVAVACAGRQVDGVIININLTWPVSVEGLRDKLGIQDLAVINDFEAVAHATRFIDPDAAVLLSGPEAGEGPVLAVGPGTGLGSAVYIPGDPEPTVLATEAGQTNLAPGTAREREVLAALAGRDAYVAHEHVLSGPGLCTLYGVVAGMRGEPTELQHPEDVTGAALAGSDATAVETLQIFCALLGSFVGNLALVYGAGGGVYLTGGILPRIHDFLRRSQFTARFLDKGRMRTFLERIPVRLMEHGQLGVIGAAGWMIEHHRK
jgi:glucokinase